MTEQFPLYFGKWRPKEWLAFNPALKCLTARTSQSLTHQTSQPVRKPTAQHPCRLFHNSPYWWWQLYNKSITFRPKFTRITLLYTTHHIHPATHHIYHSHPLQPPHPPTTAVHQIYSPQPPSNSSESLKCYPTEQKREKQLKQGRFGLSLADEQGHALSVEKKGGLKL